MLHAPYELFVENFITDRPKPKPMVDGSKRIVYVFKDDGSQYEGEVDSQNNFNGRGVMVWATGTKYDGDWKDGNMHGQGLLVGWEGEYFDGEFIDGVYQDGEEAEPEKEEQKQADKPKANNSKANKSKKSKKK